MAPILQKLTLPKLNLIGVFFKKGQILREYLSDPEDYWFLLEEQIPNEPTSKLTSLTEDEARFALNDHETVAKIDKKPFCVNLHFEDLTLCDNNTLTLNIIIRVSISDPNRFYRRYIAQFKNEPSLEGDSLHKLWEAPFRNVLQVEAHKCNLDNWKVGLTETTITKAIQQYYFAPMAIDYVDGTTLEIVESVKGNSPSEEKRLEEELAKQNAQLEQKQREFTLAQNQQKHQAELAIMQEQIRLKELDIKARQEERIAQDAAYKRRKEEEEKEALQRRQQREHEQRLALIQSNKWSGLSIEEKDIAMDFSILIKNQMEVNKIELNNTAISSNPFVYRGILGEIYTLRKGESLAFSFTPSTSGYITILNLGTSGNMTVLAPNTLTGSDTQSVKAEQNVKYFFPKSIMPELDVNAFEENASSGLEGIYVLVTKEPLLFVEKNDNLFDLLKLPYNEVQTLIDKLKGLDSSSWSGGCLEFQALK